MPVARQLDFIPQAIAASVSFLCRTTRVFIFLLPFFLNAKGNASLNKSGSIRFNPNDTSHIIYDTICSSSLPYIWKGHSLTTDTTICKNVSGGTADTCLILKIFPTSPPRPSRPASSSRVFCQGQINQIQTNAKTPQVLWEVFPPGAANFLPPLNSGSQSLQWSSGFSGKVKIVARAQSICGTSPASDTLSAWVLPMGPGKLPKPGSADSVLCKGTQFSLVSSEFPANQFLWAISPLSAGLIAGDSANIRVNWNPGFSGTAFIFFNSLTPCGFKKSDSLKIEIKPNLPTEINNLDSLYCRRPASVVLEGSPPGGQFFVNDTVMPVLPLAQAGIFTIKYQKEGCYLPSQKLVRVQLPVQAEISGLDTLYCEGLSPQPMTGSPPNGIFEVNGQIQNFFQPPDSGIYVVTYRSFCTDTASLRIRIIPAPDPKIRFRGPGFCLDSLPASLQLQPAGGQLWVNGQPSGSFIPASIGNYTLIYSVIADNCQAADTQLVNVNSRPSLLINLENPEIRNFCRRDTLVRVFGWPEGGYFSPPLSGENAFNPGTLAAGKQKISYLGLNGGCLDSASVDIRILNVPAVQAAAFPDPLCEGEPAFPLPPSQPAGGSWSGRGVSGNSFLPSAPGIFILSWNLPGIPDSTCAAFDTSVLFVRKAPPKGPSGDTTLCSNEPLVWKVDGSDYQIKWQNGSEAASQIITEKGVYFYTATQGNCSWRSENLNVQSMAEPVDFSLGETRGFCPRDSFFVTGPPGMKSYLWSMDDQILSRDSVCYPAFTGLLRLEVRNQWNCPSENTVFLRREECEEVFIPDAFSPNGDGKSEIWRVFGKNIKSLSISIFNSWGELIFAGNGKDSAWDGKYKDQDCPTGAYQYLIRYSGSAPDKQPFSGQKSGQLFLIR